MTAKRQARREPFEEEADWICRRLPSGARLLEVGCGDGRLTPVLSRCSPFSVAIDPRRERLVTARGRVGAAVRFLAASGEALPFRENSMEAVLFTLSLHHQDPVRALEEAGRVLETGGRVLVLEPAADTPMSRLFAVLHDEGENYRQAERAVAASGLAVGDCGRIDTRWVFDAFSGMTRYLFDHYGLEPDVARVEEMRRLLGPRSEETPLYIEDATRFWVLEVE